MYQIQKKLRDGCWLQINWDHVHKNNIRNNENRNMPLHGKNNKVYHIIIKGNQS